tara:strand:+ start:16393 stop:17334 length:942 start_codon:yes stop_codon:yes gene_type:complete
MSRRVVFLDTVHPVLFDRLSAEGMACSWETGIDRDSILNGACSDVHGIVLRSRLTIDLKMLTAMPNLKWIARSGAGLENIDTASADNRGVRVINSPEGNAASVGEHVIGQLLMLLHKLHISNQHVREGGWDREGHRGLELEARTVGIIGFGNMGRSLAQRLLGFGCRVLAYDKYKSGFDGDFGVEEVDFLQLCDDADVVSLHIPLTSETKGMIDAKWIGQFSQPFYLLNSARGGIAHTDAIVEALDTGSLLGAALDVLEFEMTSLEGISEKPPCFHQLAAHPKALLSPHVAGWSEESYFKLSDVLGDKILDKE